MQVAAPQGRDRILPLTVTGGKTEANTDTYLPWCQALLGPLSPTSHLVHSHNSIHWWGYSILERIRDLLKVTQLLGGRAKVQAQLFRLLANPLLWPGSTWPQTLYASFASLWCTHLSAYTCKSWALDRSPNLPKWSTAVESKRKELPFSNKINPFQAPLTFHNILTFQMIKLQMVLHVPRCQEWLWGWYKLQKAREGPIWAESHSLSTPLLDMAYSTKLVFSLLKE